MAKWLILCEYSGRMREAFRAKGHEVTSCDLLPADDNSPHHIVGDALEVARSQHWDGVIAHPPCTYLSNSGVLWLTGAKHVDGKVKRPDGTMMDVNTQRWHKMIKGAEFFAAILNLPVEKIAVENPVMHGYAKEAIEAWLWRPMPKMHFVQPWWFGHEAFKATGFALKNLEPLEKPSTALVPPKSGTPEHKRWTAQVHGLPPSKDRWKIRSTTFLGIANAAADKWG